MMRRTPKSGQNMMMLEALTLEHAGKDDDDKAHVISPSTSHRMAINSDASIFRMADQTSAQNVTMTINSDARAFRVAEHASSQNMSQSMATSKGTHNVGTEEHAATQNSSEHIATSSISRTLITSGDTRNSRMVEHLSTQNGSENIARTRDAGPAGIIDDTEILNRNQTIVIGSGAPTHSMGKRTLVQNTNEKIATTSDAGSARMVDDTVPVSHTIATSSDARTSRMGEDTDAQSKEDVEGCHVYGDGHCVTCCDSGVSLRACDDVNYYCPRLLDSGNANKCAHTCFGWNP